MNTWRADVVQGMRALAARPGFAMAAIATLALGIGANCAVFSAINGLLLRPLPYPDGERLVYIHNSYPKTGENDSGMTVPDYIDRREQADALEDSALYHERSYNLSGNGTPEHVDGIVATPSLFTTLGVNAALGRTFLAEESEVGRDHVVVLSDSLWRNGFNADPGIVGRDIRLNSESYRVVGVMPAGFGFPGRNVQLWTAFAFTPRQKSDAMRGFDFARSIGRLKPGTTRQQLEAQFALIVRRNAERFAAMNTVEASGYRSFIENSGFAGHAMDLRERQTGNVKPLLWLLQSAAIFVLLIACANVANLMLLHVASRQREWALRSALGAGQGRLARRLLMESALLALAGGGVGLIVAQGGIRLIRALGLDGSVHGFRIDMDPVVLTFAFLVMLCAMLLFGLAPLLSLLRQQPSNALKQGSRGSLGSRRSRSLRHALAVSQVALSCVLLIGAILLMRSFARVQDQPTGFAGDHVLATIVHLPPGRYPTSASAAPFHQRLMDEVRALPGVESAGITNLLPFAEGASSTVFFVEGREVSAARPAPAAEFRVVDEGFFKTLQIPVLRGRGFLPGDEAGTEKVAVVDEILAHRLFPDSEALGKRLATRSLGDARNWHTIVGIVGAVKRDRLDEPQGAGTFYLDFRQDPTRLFTLVMKTGLSTAEVVGPLRAAVRRIDPDQSMFDLRGMNERIDASLEQRRTPMQLVALFAGIALLLAAVGVHGVLAQGVAQRGREMGLRMSLGATRSDVRRLVAREGWRLVAIGMAFGLPVALALAKLIQAQLFGVDAFDPATLALALSVVVVSAMAASWLPALRASRVDPVVALRDE